MMEKGELKHQGLSVVTFCYTLAMIAAGSVPDHRGTHFVIGFMDSSSTIPLKLTLMPRTTSTVSVNITTPLMTPVFSRQIELTGGNATAIEIPGNVNLRMNANSIENKGLYIEASSEIVIYGLNAANSSNDPFLALPNDFIGSDYYAVTPEYTMVDSFSQIGIISTNVGTTNITITLPNAHPLEVEFKGKSYKQGDRIQAQLNQFQTLQLTSDSDLTGCRIVSSTPVSLIAGCVSHIDKYSNGTIYTQHIVEQLYPVSVWGKHFAAIPFSNTADLFRIVSKQSSTTVKMALKSRNTLKILGESQFTELNISCSGDIYIVIESSHPIMVIQYSNIGDATQCYMVSVPPIERSVNYYSFSARMMGHNVLMPSTVNIIIDSSYTEGIRVDGSGIPRNSWVMMNNSGSGPTYSAVQVNINRTGLHDLKHSASDVDFMAISNGLPLGILGETVCDSTCQKGGSATAAPASEGLHPGVLAIIISLCCAVFLVVACILAFVIVEVTCRRDGNSKVMPFIG
ncbi:unnamed protein product [Owenia fusiformis]|uniref:Uncharacterized protein n=1 Tax=Owenia fusiformis TaxID=6347 RepID=A0A8J1XVJ3_OWEFU|nr:unnamed protein product [Owenia fusiformis]